MSEKLNTKISWGRESDNWYVEPTWVTRRLCEVEGFEGRTVDPFAGMGNVIAGAREAGIAVEGFDLRDRGVEDIRSGRDFFDDWPPGYWPTQNIITNPPYGPVPKDDRVAGLRDRLEKRAVELALERVTSKAAFFLDAKWLNSAKRGAWVQTLPIYRVYKVGPRPSCPPGHLVQAGEKPGNGTTDFAWHVFPKGYEGPPTLHWIRRDG